MAVQKSKVTRSRRGMRRMHDTLQASRLTRDRVSKEVRLRHHVSATGAFNGRNILSKLKERTREKLKKRSEKAQSIRNA